MPVVHSKITIPSAPRGGKLVKVPLKRPGVSIMMYEAEARAKGLLPPEEKKGTQAANKKRGVSPNKAG